jgi:acetylglutamate kinase
MSTMIQEHGLATETAAHADVDADSAPVTVLKVGGARLASVADLDRLADHVRELREDGRRVVIVHGGGPEISDLHRRLDIPFEKVDGLRKTSVEGMDATAMVLCGTVQTRIVERLTARGLPSLGVSGVDLGLLRAPLVDATLLGRVGGPPTVDRGRLRELLVLDVTLVVSPVSIGPDGGAVNVNADDAAHAIAIAVQAASLDFVSDIPGVRISNDEVARALDPAAVDGLVDEGVVHGGMVPKLHGAVAAVQAGVDRVRIGDLSSMAAGWATVITAEGTVS